MKQTLKQALKHASLLRWMGVLGAAMVLPCARACPLPAPALQQGAVQAVWKVAGAPIAVGQPFALEVQVCPTSATLTRVDAVMPEHRHGMNYRPSLKALGEGRWRVEGLLLHMPGRWELRLDVQAAGPPGQTERLLDTLLLP